MKRKTHILVWFAVFLYWTFTAAIPIASLFSFRSVGLDPWDMAKVYSPLFFYPLVFGFFILPCLISPLACISRFVQVRARWKTLIGIWISLSAAVAAGDWFDHSYTPIWEIRAQVLAEKSGDGEFDLIEHFNRPKSGERSTLEQRQQFQHSLKELAVSGDHWSATHYWYGLSLFLGTLTQLGVFIIIGVLFVGTLTARQERRDEFRDSISWMLLAWIIAAIWVFMRLVSEADKLSLYAERNRGADYLVVAISLVDLIYLV